MARAKTPRSNKKNGNGAEVQAAAEPRTQAAPDTNNKKNVVPINLEDEIRRRAYELFEERGRIPGHEQDDWVRAEREVLARYSQQSA